MNSFLVWWLVTVLSLISTEGGRAEDIRAQKSALSAQSRITGGKDVKPHSVPWQAYVRTQINSSHALQCGGSLLTVRTVITAGHCCARGNTTGTYVILGAHNITKKEPTQQLIEVKRIALHEKYDDPSYANPLTKNDICILFLKQNATLNEAVQTIKLPSLKDADNDFAGKTAIATGWGEIHDSWFLAEPKLPSVLQMTELTILSNDECQKSYSVSLTIPPTVLCTDGENGRNTCSGDSGGPLTVTDEEGQQILVGLTSEGTIFCQLTLIPSTFTRVTKYLDWIAKTAHIDIAE